MVGDPIRGGAKCEMHLESLKTHSRYKSRNIIHSRDEKRNYHIVIKIVDHKTCLFVVVVVFVGDPPIKGGTTREKYC